MFHLGDPSNWVGTIKLIQVHFGKMVPNVIIHEGGLWPWEKGVCCLWDSIEFENSSWSILLCYSGIWLPFGFKRAWIFCSVSSRLVILLVNLFFHLMQVILHCLESPCLLSFTVADAFIHNLMYFFHIITSRVWERVFIFPGVLHWPGGIYFEGSTLGDDTKKVIGS